MIRLLPLLLALAASGCSLLVPLEQCESDTDCEAGSLCTTDQLCLPLCGPPFPPRHETGVVVGALQTRSGPWYSETYRSHEDAIRLAAEKVNTSGAVDDRPVSLVECDTAGDNDRALMAARYVVEQHGAVALVGLEFSSLVKALAPLSKDHGILLMSHWATSEEIHELQLRTPEPSLIWRTVGHDGHHAGKLAELARTACIDHLAVAYVDDDYGRGLMVAFEEDFCADDGGRGCLVSKTALANPYEDGEEAAAAAALKLADDVEAEEDGVQALALLAYKEHAKALAERWHEREHELALLAVEDALDPWVFEESRGFRELVKKQPVLGVTPGRSRGPRYAQFETTFLTEDPQRTIPPFAAHAYDSMILLGLAIGAVADGETVTGPRLAKGLARVSDSGAERYGPDDVMAAIQALQAGGTIDYEGASGDLDFEADYGDPTTGEVAHVLADTELLTAADPLCEATDVRFLCEPTAEEPHLPETPRCEPEDEATEGG